MQSHVDALGFHSVGAYRIWCHKQGLGKGLTKTDEQMRLEAQLLARQNAEAPPKPTVRHRPGTARSITKAYKGRHGVWTPLDDMFEATGDQKEREALYRIVIHLEKYAKVGGKLAACLARHHAEWVRPPEEWYPRSSREEGQVEELTSHLLARYDVPSFMAQAWIDDDSARVGQQQWYLHIAKGGSIRDLNTGIHLTRRMAHLFREAPGTITITMALRWAQCTGMGGSTRLAFALARSRLRYLMEDEPFWATVVRYLVNHPMLEAGQVGPVVDYVYNQKFAPRSTDGPDGLMIRHDPAQPDLVMPGRSIDKLLRQVEVWHRDLAVQKGGSMEWTSSGIGDFRCEEEDEESGKVLHWRIVELLNVRDLSREGSTMHHCIYSYKDRCASGDFSTFSIQARIGDERPLHVMTVAVDVGERTVTEYRGKYNLRPNESKTLSKKKQLRKGYLRLLNRSEGIMGYWAEQKRLRVGT